MIHAMRIGTPSLRIALLAATCGLFSACANWNTSTKSIDLDGHSAVALDVKQRVVFSQTTVLDREMPQVGTSVVTCAEPSPDALTVISASGGISFNAGPSTGAKVVNVAGSSSESGAFVGLRTQSIQLLRDALYRLCEGYAASAVNAAEFKAMQRRYQITLGGLLAIEMVTQPVVAGQALLTAAASASAGAGGESTAVTSAQQRVDDQRQKVVDAQKDLTEKSNTLSTDATTLADVNKQLAAETAADKNSTAISGLTSSVKSAQDKLAADMTEQQKSAIQVNKETTTLSESIAALRSAQARVGASSEAGGALAQIAHASSVSNAALAGAVQEIVAEVNRSYIRDDCLEILQKNGTRYKDLLKSLESVCVKVVEADIDQRRVKLDIDRFDAERKLIVARTELASKAATETPSSQSVTVMPRQVPTLANKPSSRRKQ